MAMALGQDSEFTFYLNSKDADELKPYLHDLDSRKVNYELYVQRDRDLPMMDFDCVWIYTLDSIKRTLSEILYQNRK